MVMYSMSEKGVFGSGTHLCLEGVCSDGHVCQKKVFLALAPTCVWKERVVMVMYVRKGVLALAPTCFVR